MLAAGGEFEAAAVGMARPAHRLECRADRSDTEIAERPDLVASNDA